MAKKEYRLAIGNTTFGEIGICFSVAAESEEEAISIARKRLETVVTDGITITSFEERYGVEEPIFDVRLYLNHEGKFEIEVEDVTDVPENA